MAKFAAINSSDLGSECWAPKRHFGDCHECHKVQTCRLPEGAKGRMDLELKRLNVLKRAMERQQKVYNDAVVKFFGDGSHSK